MAEMDFDEPVYDDTAPTPEGGDYYGDVSTASSPHRRLSHDSDESSIYDLPCAFFRLIIFNLNNPSS